MIKLTYEITLKYANDSVWLVGSFDSMTAANAWIAAEQAQPYWQASTQIIIKEISTEVPVL